MPTPHPPSGSGVRIGEGSGRVCGIAVARRRRHCSQFLASGCPPPLTGCCRHHPFRPQLLQLHQLPPLGSCPQGATIVHPAFHPCVKLTPRNRPLAAALAIYCGTAGIFAAVLQGLLLWSFCWNDRHTARLRQWWWCCCTGCRRQVRNVDAGPAASDSSDAEGGSSAGAERAGWCVARAVACSCLHVIETSQLWRACLGRPECGQPPPETLACPLVLLPQAASSRPQTRWACPCPRRALCSSRTPTAAQRWASHMQRRQTSSRAWAAAPASTRLPVPPRPRTTGGAAAATAAAAVPAVTRRPRLLQGRQRRHVWRT